jgi:hypothetical protein
LRRKYTINNTLKTICYTFLTDTELHGNLSKSPKICSPHCEFFKCGQYALRRSGRNVTCSWAEDSCTGGKCNYAICIKRRLLTDGTCSMTVGRKEKKELFPEIIEEPNYRIRGKTLRRLGKEKTFYH